MKSTYDKKPLLWMKKYTQDFMIKNTCWESKFSNFWKLTINSFKKILKFPMNTFILTWLKLKLVLYPRTWNFITCNAIVYRPVGECQLSIHRCSKNTDKSPWLPPHDSGSSKSSIYNFQCHQEYCFFGVQICSLFIHYFLKFYNLIPKQRILNFQGFFLDAKLVF